MLGILPPALLDVYLPAFGIYGISWSGPVLSALWICIIGYSIIRHRQMNVRAVATEVLAIAMAMLFFINIFVNTPFEPWDDMATFAAFLILAIYLIRGVLHEAKQREELNDLNQNLEAKVAAKTVEVRKTLESEKHARMELEKLNDAKNQFIMMTQHNMRTPVSNIASSLAEALGGSYGPLSAELKESLESARYSSGRLSKIMDEFLSIATIKAGTSILNLKPASLKPAVEDILSELKVPINRMELQVDYPRDDSSWQTVLVDYPKLRECLFVVLDNTVRYNQKRGSVRIAPRMLNGSFELSIENTGLGISRDESEKMGSTMFYRSERARQAYPVGMGVGLSMVRAIVAAHKGSFEITSQGPGKGATATIALPI